MSLCLWLDDERPAPPGWTTARTVDEAKGIAKSSKVQKMSLDHDLGGSVAAHGGSGTFNHGTPTGMEFVKWMAKTRNWPTEKPIVHSANFHGGQSMKALIDRAWAPDHGPARECHLPGHHVACGDPACCRCDCPNCMTDWNASGRPTEKDCAVHGRKA